MGLALTTTRSYLYGKTHFTSNGFALHRQTIVKPDFPDYTDILEDMSSKNLTDKNYVITGANSGLGYEITRFLYSKGANVNLVCRNKERGEDCIEKLQEECSLKEPHRLKLSVCDVSLESNIRQFERDISNDRKWQRIDGLICNAGNLDNERRVTNEGIEMTYATHMLFGTYLLGKVMLPWLGRTKDSRLIIVSSGGMLTTKMPKWEIATNSGPKAADKFDGQLAYAYSKRMQVLLAEEWSKEYRDSGVKIVSCHPGWVDTPGVERTYGTGGLNMKSWLQPLRNLWEGVDGICWLAVAPADQIESGAFYLDRLKQEKHLGSSWFESSTRNSPEEVAEMMQRLKMESHFEK